MEWIIEPIKNTTDNMSVNTDDIVACACDCGGGFTVDCGNVSCPPFYW